MGMVATSSCFPNTCGRHEAAPFINKSTKGASKAQPSHYMRSANESGKQQKAESRDKPPAEKQENQDFLIHAATTGIEPAHQMVNFQADSVSGQTPRSGCLAWDSDSS